MAAAPLADTLDLSRDADIMVDVETVDGHLGPKTFAFSSDDQVRILA